MDEDKKGHKKRLRERFCKDGLRGFHDYEVLELILSYSLIRRDTKSIAKDLIGKFGSLTEVINAPVHKLKSVKGIGERTAVLIKLVRAAGDFHLKESIIAEDCISSPKDVYSYLNFHYQGKFVEEFVVIFLNSANAVIDVEPVFSGTIDRSAIYVRELIKKVLELKSSAVILAHNHPSGNLSPSIQDRQVTKKIGRALSYIDVKLIDHIVYGNGDFYSFQENNLL